MNEVTEMMHAYLIEWLAVFYFKFKMWQEKAVAKLSHSHLSDKIDFLVRQALGT